MHKLVRKKGLLFTGLILLTTGVLLRIFSEYKSVALFLIVAGAFFKMSYILVQYRQGNYKPGFELAFLLFGLALFFVGIYLRGQGSAIAPYFMYVGIALKASFVLIFIGKSRSSN